VFNKEKKSKKMRNAGKKEEKIETEREKKHKFKKLLLEIVTNYKILMYKSMEICNLKKEGR
jgi:hypothetical protein